MELKNCLPGRCFASVASGKRSWKRRVPNHRGDNCGIFETYEYRVCDRSAGIKTEGTARRLEGWHATQAVPSSNLLNRLNLSPFIPELAGPAVAAHLNSGFPKPVAPTGAASQSYQLLPVADLLRLSSIFNIFSVLPPEQRLSGYTSENALKIAESLKSARRGT